MAVKAILRRYTALRWGRHPQFLAARVEGRTVGTVLSTTTVSADAGATVTLHALVVDEEFHGCGIGRALLSRCIAMAASAARIEGWCSKKSKAMRRLLKSLGFKEAKKASDAASFSPTLPMPSLWALELGQADSAPNRKSPARALDRSDPRCANVLFSFGNRYFARGAYSQAISFYQDLMRHELPHAEAFNNLGAALCQLGRYKEAEDNFRQAIVIRPDNSEAHANLGNLLRWKGYFAEAESSLRRALELSPNNLDTRINLALCLASLGRLREAKVNFEHVLRVAPRRADALGGLGLVARLEGRFNEAEALFKVVVEDDPKTPGACAALVGVRKMTPDDAPLLARLEEIAASGIASLEEAEVRFAIGKYCDDVGNFERAFLNYKRANELLKPLAETYAPGLRTRFVDELIRAYTKETLSHIDGGASDSAKPVFVVGMMRSGTSLAEQIIASHPAAKGAGELRFWTDAVGAHAAALRRGLLDKPIRKELAAAYLRVLDGHSVDALRVVDKAPLNADYLGVIHSVLPKARMIYMQRDPIDSCLSSYFQSFPPALNFAMDLSDLAHYCAEHRRLVAHWLAVLPPGTILEVPYSALIAEPEKWTRKILDFIGLEWDERCLDFHTAKRPVMTASYLQVRQKIYSTSVGRWRNYEKFIGPLLGLV